MSWFVAEYHILVVTALSLKKIMHWPLWLTATCGILTLYLKCFLQVLSKNGSMRGTYKTLDADSTLGATIGS